MQRYSSLYNRAKEMKLSYNNKIKDIEMNWAAVVHEKKMAELTAEYESQFKSMRLENDKILDDYINSYKAEKEAYRKTDEYKEKLSYSLDMIHKFPNLSGQVMDKLLQPLVDAGDEMTLSVLKDNNPTNTSIIKAMYELDQDTSKMENINKFMDYYLQSYTENPIHCTLEGIFHQEGGAE